VVVERPGNTTFVTLAYRVPPALHPDWMKLEVMDSILTGASGAKTSRMYQALVKTGVAAHTGGGLQETIDPYLYTLRATVSDNHTPEQTERALLEQLDHLLQDGVTEAELAKAKKQARASFAYSTESVTNQAYWLAQSAALGDIDWFSTYMDRLNAITREDVLSVAQTYLTPRRRITGWLIPTQDGDAS
jgi:zinc protease